MKPAISYYGGKQRLASRLVKHIPRHTVYVEPFAGGAAVFFKKPWPAMQDAQSYREVLNDTDGELMNFYTVLRDHGEELYRALQMTPYSLKEYHNAVQTEDLEILSPVERARRYYIHIQQSFGNKLHGGWARTTSSQNHAYSFYNARSRLLACVERMQCVYLENRDALEVIASWDSPQTFFYCDPPYPDTDQGHYGGYTYEDLQALFDTLDQCQGSWMVSNYPQEDLRLPQHTQEKALTAVSSVSSDLKKRGARNEMVWFRGRKAVITSKRTQQFWSDPALDCFEGGDPHLLEPALDGE